MRATWPGARSGRITIVTGPLEVSRRSVLSRSASGFWVIGGFGFLFLAGFHDGDHEGASRNGSAELLGDGQRGAAIKHVNHCPLIGGPDFRSYPGRRKGEPRLAENRTVACEGKPYCDLHARPGDIIIRHPQA